jgi:hypothetical protein
MQRRIDFRGSGVEEAALEMVLLCATQPEAGH